MFQHVNQRKNIHLAIQKMKDFADNSTCVISTTDWCWLKYTQPLCCKSPLGFPLSWQFLHIHSSSSSAVLLFLCRSAEPSRSETGFHTVSPAVNTPSPVIRTVESLQWVRGDRSLLKRERELSHHASRGDGVCSVLQRESHRPSRGDDIKDEHMKARGDSTLNTESYMCYW